MSTIPLAITGGILQLGDAISCYCLSKVLALKYNIPFCYSYFKYHHLFEFSNIEESDLSNPIWQSDRIPILVHDESDIINHLHHHVIFITHLRTKINYIAPEWVAMLKKNIQLKNKPSVVELPKNVITVGVHIRKGNGGGEIYDGETTSEQEFDFDRSVVMYRTDFENYPFDWRSYQRHNGCFTQEYLPFEDVTLNSFPIDNQQLYTFLDKAPNAQTQFPPNQFYSDQIIKISTDLKDALLFVHLVTDDKDPKYLLQKIIKAVNKPNIIFYYEDNRHLPFAERIHQDLYMLSRCTMLIRGQSGFARIAELLGNHTLVMYPLKYQWLDKKLIMTEVVIKGSFTGSVH